MTLSSPSGEALLALFAPYCGGRRQERALQSALDRLPLGRIDGERARRDASPHRFRLTWSEVSAPLQTCRCELSFQDQPQQLYSFECPAHQLLDWLMHCPDSGHRDLPDSFWQWLFLERVAEDGGL